jgi:hypothetical protein
MILAHLGARRYLIPRCLYSCRLHTRWSTPNWCSGCSCAITLIHIGSARGVEESMAERKGRDRARAEQSEAKAPTASVHLDCPWSTKTDESTCSYSFLPIQQRQRNVDWSQNYARLSAWTKPVSSFGYSAAASQRMEIEVTWSTGQWGNEATRQCVRRERRTLNCLLPWTTGKAI